MNNRGNLRVAAYLIPRRGGEILLLKRHNTGYEDGNYSFIAGHVEHTESPTQSIVREAREEAGIEIDPGDLKFIQVVHRRCPDDLVYIDYFFTIDRWNGDIRIAEPDKCSALDWFSAEQLPSNIIPYIKDVIARWRQKEIDFHEFGWKDNKTN